MFDVINDDLIVISAKKHTSVGEIDGGDTVFVVLEGAASEVVSLLLPYEAALMLAQAISNLPKRSLGRDRSN